MGVSYQGVYDKKYCKPILDKINADYFIMTKFVGPSPDTPNHGSISWGYEIKILNTKSWHQMVSIGKSGLKDAVEIEADIKNKIDILIQDIENLL